MKLVNTNRFILAGTNNRFLHVATIVDGLHEFMCMYDLYTQKLYIEEITGGHLEFIQDDALANALAEFLRESGVLDANKPMLPDNQWLLQKP